MSPLPLVDFVFNEFRRLPSRQFGNTGWIIVAISAAESINPLASRRPALAVQPILWARLDRNFALRR
jgi:hypothetical protein